MNSRIEQRRQRLTAAQRVEIMARIKADAVRRERRESESRQRLDDAVMGFVEEAAAAGIEIDDDALAGLLEESDFDNLQDPDRAAQLLCESTADIQRSMGAAPEVPQPAAEAPAHWADKIPFSTFWRPTG
jgi:hypothetical protein